MIILIEINDQTMAEKILNVQIPSYQVEAQIIGYSDLPPLLDTINTLQQCGEAFYGYYVGEELGGVISIKIEQGVLDIHRLIVHPKYFRKGIAQRLLEFIEAKEGINTLIVSTGSKNTPAVNFYMKNGFKQVKEIRVNEHLSLTSFEKGPS